jgi:hypothetical protein
MGVVRHTSTAAADDYLFEVGGPPSAPPFRFSGVDVRVFPLRASLSRLKRFCDDYLNLFRDVAEFVPLDNFVELVVLEYPSMTSQEQPAFATYGQTEVFFLLPVLWTNAKTGKTRLAALIPYIFVDNPVSARLGRDVFGWPKEAAWYHRNSLVSGNNVQLLAIDKETLVDGNVTTSRLLEVELHGARERLTYGRRTAQPGASFDLNGVLGLLGQPIRVASRGFALWKRALQGLVTQWRAPTELLNVNLKQSPQLEPSGSACYQAITVTPLRLSRLNAFGLLGERQQLLGDSSGGCVVRIFEDPTWPVVTQLGLDFDEAPREHHEHGRRIAYEFKPVFPVWMSTDFEQLTSQILVSRGTETGSAMAAKAPMVNVLGSRGLLNATRSMSFTGGRLQLLELPADIRAQERLVEALNGIEMDYAFGVVPGSTAHEASVLLAIASFTGMRSDHISLPDWQGTLVELYVPVSYRKRSEVDAAAAPALFGHSAFATSSALCNTLHETLGSNVTLASMASGQSGLREDDSLRLLTLSTMVVPLLQLGEVARIAPVLDVRGRPRGAGRPASHTSASLMFANLPLLHLKQLPSAENPRKTSYQALVMSAFDGVRAEQVDDGIEREIVLYEYESLRLLQALGLRGQEPDAAAGRPKQATLIRPRSETHAVLGGQVTAVSQVLWERLLR